MYEKMSEQMHANTKPMSELFALNSTIVQEAAEKQRQFFTEMLNEGMNFSKELSSQKDFSGLYQVQKSYLEGVQEKMLNASTDAYEFLTSIQQRAGNAMRSGSQQQS